MREEHRREERRREEMRGEENIKQGENREGCAKGLDDMI